MSKLPPPIPLAEAQRRLLALREPMPEQRVPVAKALGFYLAEPLVARRTQPAADLSAMDGYALTPGDLGGPWQVIGESAAGHPFAGRVDRGQAVRIATGAVLPEGADVVMLQEDVTRVGDTVTLSGTPPSPPSKHIRRRGMDFSDSDPLLHAGSRIGPTRLALAISAGHTEVSVHRSPSVAVLDSGDELIAEGQIDDDHHIPASNGAMLAAMALGLPTQATSLGPVADSMEAIRHALTCAQDCDVLVTSGGASVGDHDLMRPALEAWGARIDFWRVAIKPGKPLLVATRETAGRTQLILGLPGNPVSSFVTAHLFMLPLLRALLGAADPFPPCASARLTEKMPANGPRQTFVRARWDGETVAPLTNQDSGALAALAAANALIVREGTAPEANVGDRVSIHLIGNGGNA